MIKILVVERPQKNLFSQNVVQRSLHPREISFQRYAPMFARGAIAGVAFSFAAGFSACNREWPE